MPAGTPRPSRSAAASPRWDEHYTRQMEDWLAQPDLPEPFCLVWCLINPHDVLGYPNSFEQRRLHALRSSPTCTCRCRRRSTRTCARSPRCRRCRRSGRRRIWARWRRASAQQRYVRLLRPPAPRGGSQHRAAARRAGGAATVAPLAHRDRAHVGPRRARALARRPAPEDVQRLRGGAARAARRLGPGALSRARPAMRWSRWWTWCRRSCGLAGGAADGRLSTGSISGPCCAASATRVRDAVLFTYDDHQAGTAFQDAPGQPNRIRCVRDARWKYAVYVDPPAASRPSTSSTTSRQTRTRRSTSSRWAPGAGRTAAARARAAAAAGEARGAVRCRRRAAALPAASSSRSARVISRMSSSKLVSRLPAELALGLE